MSLIDVKEEMFRAGCRVYSQHRKATFDLGNDLPADDHLFAVTHTLVKRVMPLVWEHGDDRNERRFTRMFDASLVALASQTPSANEAFRIALDRFMLSLPEEWHADIAKVVHAIDEGIKIPPIDGVGDLNEQDKP